MPFVRRTVAKRRVGAPKRKYTRKFGHGAASKNGLKPTRSGVVIRSKLNPRSWFSGNWGGKMMLNYNKMPYANEERFSIQASQLFILSGTTGGVMGTTGGILINDLAHPWINPTSTDHDPYGVTQLSDRYLDYKVSGCTIKFTFANAYSTTSYCAILPQARDDSYTLGSENFVKTREKPGVKVILGGECCSASTQVNSAGQLPYLMDSFTVCDLDGITKTQWDADVSEYAGAFGSSPNFRPYIRFGVGDFAGGNSSSMDIIVDVIFHGIAYNRKTANSS